MCRAPDFLGNSHAGTIIWRFPKIRGVVIDPEQ